MGQIRIFNRPPKSFEFDKEDLVIDNVRGDVYYKDDKNRLQKIIKSNDTSTSLSVANLIATTAISSTSITSSAILVGNITASGNISASGTVFADNFQSSGQQQITVADSFNITGSITASGGISSSEDLTANNITGVTSIESTLYTIDGQNAIDFANNTHLFGSTAKFSKLRTQQGLEITAPITASGNISSSGNIIGLTGSFNQTIITLKSGAQESPFIITIADNNGQGNKLEVTKDGALKLGALNTLPTAITGGLVYSSSAFYMGI
tara:strand:+ start:98 stop:895 length:798 start_codon:yes stop_codon:yes gene_type:complete